MLLLPNGFKCSRPKVCKSAKGWKVWYRFYDDHPKPLYKEISNVNHLEDLKARMKVCQALIADEIDRLRRGYNPRKKAIIVESGINPFTPFVVALQLAYENLTSQHHTKEDIKSSIKYITLAANALRFDTLPVESVRRKHIKELLKKLGSIKKTWTANTFNAYRKNLRILFEELIENDATEVNPVDGIRKQKHAPKKRVLLTEDQCREVDRFALAYDPAFHRLIHIFFHSGARTTEIVKVQGKHVDLKKQTVKYLVLKGRHYEWIERPIKDIALPFWIEALKGCAKEDYVFAKGLVPGEIAIHPSQLGRRWKRHIVGKLGIEATWYGLKYLNTSSTIDLMQQLREDSRNMAAQTGHKSEAMVIKIYDQNHESRKNEALKKIANRFA